MEKAWTEHYQAKGLPIHQSSCHIVHQLGCTATWVGKSKLDIIERSIMLGGSWNVTEANAEARGSVIQYLPWVRSRSATGHSKLKVTVSLANKTTTIATIISKGPSRLSHGTSGFACCHIFRSYMIRKRFGNPRTVPRRQGPSPGTAAIQVDSKVSHDGPNRCCVYCIFSKVELVH